MVWTWGSCQFWKDGLFWLYASSYNHPHRNRIPAVFQCGFSNVSDGSLKMPDLDLMIHRNPRSHTGGRVFIDLLVVRRLKVFSLNCSLAQVSLAWGSELPELLHLVRVSYTALAKLWPVSYHLFWHHLVLVQAGCEVQEKTSGDANLDYKDREMV